MISEEKIVYNKDSGFDFLKVAYYPGMLELSINDSWHDNTNLFNMSIADWRAMNVAVEAEHNGENDAS